MQNNIISHGKPVRVGAPMLPRGFCEIIRPTALGKTILIFIFPWSLDYLLSEFPFQYFQGFIKTGSISSYFYQFLPLSSTIHTFHMTLHAQKQEFFPFFACSSLLPFPLVQVTISHLASHRLLVCLYPSLPHTTAWGVLLYKSEPPVPPNSSKWPEMSCLLWLCPAPLTSSRTLSLLFSGITFPILKHTVLLSFLQTSNPFCLTNDQRPAVSTWTLLL